MILVIQNEAADDRPRRVFVSYSHQDEDWKDRIVEALKPLEEQQRISAWDDRKLLPGEEWDGTIKRELNDADVILFLVSQAFLDSTYCREVEVQRAVARSNDGEAVLVPIIVRRCNTGRQACKNLLLWRCRFQHHSISLKDPLPVMPKLPSVPCCDLAAVGSKLGVVAGKEDPHA